MHFLNLFFVIILMSFTWLISQPKEELKMINYHQIEEQVEDIIAETVYKKYSDLKELEFESVYSEKTDSPKKLKVHFTYKQEHNDSSSKTVSGTAFLESFGDDIAQWKILKVDTTTDSLSLAEEVITSEPSTPPATLNEENN